MEKFLVKKSLIQKDLSSTQGKHDDYIIAYQILLYHKIHTLLLFYFIFVMLCSSFVMNTLEKIISGAATDQHHIVLPIHMMITISHYFFVCHT